MNAQLIAPVLQDLSLAVHGYVYVVALVPLLFAICGPAAIVRAVPRIVVDAINLQPRGVASTHILRKRGYIVPAFADSNSTTAVMLKSAVMSVVAALHHVTPNAVQRAVPQAVLSEEKTILASAASRLASLYAAQRANNLLPAVAFVVRFVGVTAGRLSKFKNSDTAKSGARRDGFAGVGLKVNSFVLHNFPLLRVTS